MSLELWISEGEYFFVDTFGIGCPVQVGQALIGDFIEKIGELRPRLITFNGHNFDLPVLRYRAMVNRVPAAGLQVRQDFHRYTEDALDL